MRRQVGPVSLDLPLASQRQQAFDVGVDRVVEVVRTLVEQVLHLALSAELHEAGAVLLRPPVRVDDVEAAPGAQVLLGKHRMAG